MNSWAITDKGIIRQQNQDSYYAYCDPEHELALSVVCDGMGGANAGNVASKLAAETFVDSMNNLYGNNASEEMDTDDILLRSAAKANKIVYEKSLEGPDYSGMGTTIVAALTDGDNATVLNIGDSRAYRITGDGIYQITKDHSVIEELIDRGDITREESRHHPSRNLITRALGTCPEIAADIFHVELTHGDSLLLCSDGLTNVLSDEEILNTVRTETDREKAGRKLVDMVLERGAPDNITLILLER